MSAHALALQPRSSAAALLAAYALFRTAPAAARMLRALRRTLAAADDVSAVVATLAKEVRTLVLDRAPAAPRALRRVLRALAAPDALRILRHIAAAATLAVMKATRPTPTIALAPRQDTKAFVDAALQALDSPHGKRVAATIVAAATREAVTVLTAPCTRRKMQVESTTSGEPPLVDRVMDAATSERGRALLLDALAVAVRAAVPAVLAAQARPPAVSPTPPAPQSTPRSCAPQSPPQAPTPQSPPSQSPPSTPTPLERVAARVLHDQSLVRDVVRTAAAEAVRAYLTTNARLRLAAAAAASATPSPAPSPQRAPPRSLTPVSAAAAHMNADARRRRERERAMRALQRIAQPAEDSDEGGALWRTVASALAADARRWMLRVASARPGPGWTLF